MEKILYYSTNKSAPLVDLETALLTGQAPDKGLYMPTVIPKISTEELINLQNKKYFEIAEFVLGKYVLDTFSKQTLRKLCEDAYNYDVPLEKVENKTYIMRLDRGPTASFKDFAARMMGRMIGALMQNESRELVILTATSGDTGSAIAHAFHKIPNIKVMVLFPPNEVSDRQRKQMTTLGDNITTVGVRGKFDDCQALVKQAFADNGLKDIRLTSANSINIGRLLPQIVYYIYAYVKLVPIGEEIVFSVPSGNFGDMMGALLAKRMGLPIKQIVIATNENDEVPKFMESGIYQKIVPSKKCISNAMNVGHPSNFARVIDLFGGQMDETGKILSEPDLKEMKKDLWAISISDDLTRKTIKDVWEKYQVLLEPHGAVGWAGLSSYFSNSNYDGFAVSVETAHPAKFPEEIKKLIGIVPEVPESLKGIELKKEKFLDLPVDYEQFKKLLKEMYIP